MSSRGEHFYILLFISAGADAASVRTSVHVFTLIIQLTPPSLARSVGACFAIASLS